jgi:hypothetical protein
MYVSKFYLGGILDPSNLTIITVQHNEFFLIWKALVEENVLLTIFFTSINKESHDEYKNPISGR